MNTYSRKHFRNIGDAIRTVFPNGSMPNIDGIDFGSERKNNWNYLPYFPTDLFAVTGYIIETSGLIGYFEPNPEFSHTLTTSELSNNDLRFTITQGQRKSCIDFGKKWRMTSQAEVDVIQLWNCLIRDRNEPLRASEYEKLGEIPSWWNAVVQLHIIADEAAQDLGHQRPKLSNKNFIIKYTDWLFRSSRKKDAPDKDGTTAVMGRPVATLAVNADADIIAVQPKCRVAGTGCTTRSLSKNLALTPPVGSVRCHWQQLLHKPKSEDDEALDILLIPLPYDLRANWFSPVEDNRSRGKNSKAKRPNWDNFEVKQKWLEPTWIKGLVIDLIVEAKKDVVKINGLIFPEYAITFEIFKDICRCISEIEPNIEFVIAGSSTNCEDVACNNVLTAIWEDAKEPNYYKQVVKNSEKKENIPNTRITSQKKHHRWRLENSQISDYALASSLNPKKFWWENHTIRQRELNFFQFRKSSIFSSLICEDLARSDPCHEIVRSIGPNLVFALLMDGPQLQQRWSARYASGLADDPGCSVLTLTSFGLIQRQNDNRKYAYSDIVGLWKDESGNSVNVGLPQNAKGILLSLSGEHTQDQTVDGRISKNAISWRFHSQRPLFIKE